MFDVIEKPQKVERAILISVYEDKGQEQETQELLLELAELVKNLSIGIIEKFLVKIRKINASYYVGSGKMDEIISFAKDNKCDCIIFDNALSPAQQRNWEKEAGICVIDREEVILDIFAQRAQTREAKIQVGLARMHYSLPRLKRMWAHLDRQAGGIGTRGEGETQLEIDRRLVREKIKRLKVDLDKVKSERKTRRQKRIAGSVSQVAIVGYTNSGKSTLLNKLTNAEVLAEDKLFATLDPTTRGLDLPTGQGVMLTDTVGFVRNLPHNLVEAFKSTLEESLVADLLLHVLDASDASVVKFYETTKVVLEDLGVGEKPSLLVLNKFDLIEDDLKLQNELRITFPTALVVSAKTGYGLEVLLNKVADFFAKDIVRLSVLLPFEHRSLLKIIHDHGKIFSQEFTESGEELEFILPKSKAHAFEEFAVN